MRSELRSLHPVFLERLKKIVGLQKFDAIANTFSQAKPTTFRANTLKASCPEIRESLEKLYFKLETVPWYSDAFVLKEGRLRELQETDLYREGKIYVQNLSSMIPPLVLNPQPKELILDLAAAPGSKTTQMAMLMKGEGKMIANDNNKIRFFKLKANLEIQGCSQVEASLKYGESFGREYPESFDRVLLDAPCSSEGRFNIREPASYSYWKPQKVHEMAQKQKKLIYSAISALRPEGVLVYSTCTFAPEENEGVLQWALEKFPNMLEIESVSLSIPNKMPGLAQWNDQKFDPSIRQSLRVLPTSTMEGFFVARLRKKGNEKNLLTPSP